MACIWNNVDYTVPPTGIKLLAKYNPFRSDVPLRYVVVKFDGKWKTEYMNGPYFMESLIPAPDWWALIESEDDHA